MNIICLDAEFADNEELLELSIFNREEEVYHSYYKPENIEDWRTDIHHITPEMVMKCPSFSSQSTEVQNIINKADLITGFAVDNDLRVLTRAAINGLEDKIVLDVKDMYWFLKGRKTEMSPYSVPSLIICANSLGIDFKEMDAHSASVDTSYTLKCFHLLLNEYKADKEDSISLSEIVKTLISEIEDAKAEFVAEGAKGYIRVLRAGEYFKIKFSHLEAEDKQRVFMEIEVEDRYKAEYEIRKLLKKKEVPGKFGMYKLTNKHLSDIRNYRNIYDADESAWCKKIVRNLSRLSL
ncbi:MAG: hypothetical protein HDR88_03200 [Bacteroides sp.]|nr:hypothetical protein [Bacteroides sp.]